RSRAGSQPPRGAPPGPAWVTLPTSALPRAPGARSIATAEGKAGMDTGELAAFCTDDTPSGRPWTASSVRSESMAPRPSDTWSVRVSPIEGSVTVPTIVRARLSRPVPMVTVSPIRLPSWRRVATPSSIWRGLAIGWPLVVGGSTEPRCRVSPSTGTVWPSMGIWVNAKVDQPVTPGWPLTSLSIYAAGQLPYPPWLSISSVQFQPYRAGWFTSPVRLAPNATAIATAMTATTEPIRVVSTGTGRRPSPRSSASRGPTRGGQRRARGGGGGGGGRGAGGGGGGGGARRPP